MRKRVLSFFVGAAALVTLTGLAPAATAFWSASGSAPMAVIPATLGFVLEATNEEISIEGESGVAYTSVLLYDESSYPLDAITVNTEFEGSGFTAVAQSAIVQPNDPCETQNYEALSPEVTLAEEDSYYVLALFCFRIEYSGATSDHIDQQLRLSVTAEGTLESWSTGTTGAETIFTLTNAPDAPPLTPTTPTLFCKQEDFFARIGAQDADPNYRYELRQNTADGALTRNPESDANGLATGWALTPHSFDNLTPNALFDVFIVRADNDEAIGTATLYYNASHSPAPRIECLT